MIKRESRQVFYFIPMIWTRHTSVWEVGFGWAMAQNGEPYRGKNAAMALKDKERIKLVALVFDHSEALKGGEN